MMLTSLLNLLSLSMLLTEKIVKRTSEVPRNIFEAAEQVQYYVVAAPHELDHLFLGHPRI